MKEKLLTKNRDVICLKQEVKIIKRLKHEVILKRKWHNYYTNNVKKNYKAYQKFLPKWFNSNFKPRTLYLVLYRGYQLILYLEFYNNFLNIKRICHKRACRPFISCQSE